MEQQVYKKHALDMIYLVNCALSGTVPAADRLSEMELPAVFGVCQKHILTACAAYALESAGVRDPAFTEAKEKAIRKNILLDAERKKVLARLEQAGIWYLPLKGAILKDWYPRLGMRQMSDNDILYDASRREDVRQIMTDLGFTFDPLDRGVDDSYYKEPVCHIEMHTALFGSYSFSCLHAYYADVKARLCKDAEGGYGYHFRNEDFYLYQTAHAYKHDADGGTGVRSLYDTAVLLRKFADRYDWDYLRAELEKLGLTEYEAQNRLLSEKLLSGAELSPEEQERLDFHIFSGAYGTVTHQMQARIAEKGHGLKWRYLFGRIFPPAEFYSKYYPWAYRHRVLLPAAWFCRGFRILLIRPRRLITELRQLRK